MAKQENQTNSVVVANPQKMLLGMPLAAFWFTFAGTAIALAFTLTEMSPPFKFWLACASWLAVLVGIYYTARHSSLPVSVGRKSLIAIAVDMLVLCGIVPLLVFQWSIAYPPTGPCVHPLSFAKKQLPPGSGRNRFGWVLNVSTKGNRQLRVHANGQILGASSIDSPKDLNAELGVLGPPLEVLQITVKGDAVPKKMDLTIQSPYRFEPVCAEYVDTPTQPVREILTKPLELSDRAAYKNFISALREYPIESKDTVEVGCAEGSEASCARAGRYLIALSEADWPLLAKDVRRISLATPQPGVALVTHSDAPVDPNRPIHIGTWTAMNESETALWGAFQALGITPRSIGVDSIPIKREILYFGPELDK